MKSKRKVRVYLRYGGSWLPRMPGETIPPGAKSKLVPWSSQFEPRKTPAPRLRRRRLKSRAGRKALKNPPWVVQIQRRGGKGPVLSWSGRSFSDNDAPLHFPSKARAAKSARTLVALNRKLDDYKVWVQPHPRRNPESLDAAAKKLEDFTGHPATHVERVRSRSRQKTGLVLGPLKAVEYIATRDNSTDIWRHKFRESSRPLLAVSTDGKQLHIVGGRYEFTEAGIEDR